MSNIDSLNADLIKLLSNAKITFSQVCATDLQKRYLAPGLNQQTKKTMMTDERKGSQVYKIMFRTVLFESKSTIRKIILGLMQEDWFYLI